LKERRRKEGKNTSNFEHIAAALFIFFSQYANVGER